MANFSCLLWRAGQRYNFLVRVPFVFLGVSFLLATSATGYAFVLDWGSATPGLTDGDADHTFTNVDGSGIDIRVRVTGNLDFTNSTPGVRTLGSPVNDDVYQVFMNWGDDTDEIRIRLLFYETGTSTRAEVRNLTFSIYDIDRRGEDTVSGVEDDTPDPDYVYQDQIDRIQGRTATTGFNGANIFPDITAGATGTGSIDISNSGASNANITGQGYYDSENAKARADLTFNQDVAGLSFYYGNGPSFSGNPAGQTILFGGVTFEAVPEPGTWVAGAALVFLFSLARSRNKSISKSR